MHEGRVIAERYAPGYGLATAIAGNSATKSVVSALVGILVREGRIAVHQPAPVAAWRNPGDSRHAITIDQLLRMTAGFSTDERGFPPPATRMWFLEPDVAEFAAHRSIVAVPGSTWNYSNANYELLSRILRDSVGGPAEVLQFAQRELFAPLGMHSVTLEFDATGTPMGSKFMFASARDWARFGLLYLGDGVVGDIGSCPRVGCTIPHHRPSRRATELGFGQTCQMRKSLRWVSPGACPAPLGIRTLPAAIWVNMSW